MYFINDKKDHLWSYCSIMCHVFAAEAAELTTEMRQNIEKAGAVISVALAGTFVYVGQGEDDVDAFILHTPSGFVLVMSSEAAKLNAETLAYIFGEVDRDASLYGPELEYNCAAAYSKQQKRAPDAREPLAV